MAHLLISPKIKFVDSNGLPLVGGKIYSYQAGTTTPLATYVDQTEATPNVNPVILDANGEADVWLGANSYKIVLTDPSDVVLWTSDNIASVNNGSITALKLASNSVTTIKILDANVTTPKIANSAVTTIKIADSNVTTVKIADANVTTAKIADANVTTAKIADANVTTAKIADSNVTTVKILDANVTTAKLASQAVTTRKITSTGFTQVVITNGSTTSSTYSTIATGSFTKADDVTFVRAVLFANYLGSTGDSYLRLSGAASSGGTDRQITLAGNLTLEVIDGGVSRYYEATIGHGFFAPNSIATTGQITYPPGTFYFNLRDDLLIGTYTFNLKWKVSVTGSSVTATLSSNNVSLAIIEGFEWHV